MALDGTYTGLKASVADWLKRTDLTASIPDLIVLADARIARDLRLRAQITFATLTTSSSVDYVALPADFLEIENIGLTTGGVQRPLTYESPEQLNARFPYGGGNGIPLAYSILGDRIYFGYAPDSAYTVGFTYYARFSPLSVTATNWLLTSHPSIYLFATLAEAAPFMLDDARVGMWEGKYQADMQALTAADDESLRSGSVLRVRVI
jgi:hypothetical protein